MEALTPIPMRPFIARYDAWILLVLIPLLCAALAWALSLAIPMPPRDSFNVVQWELKHLPGKWLYMTEQFFSGGLSREEQDERLARFLLLSGRIRRLESNSAGNGSPELDELRRQRDGLENDVEAMIEGRLTSVLEDASLDSSIPLFPGARWVFPPVDFEVEQPLQVLSVSPRERIELTGGRPLKLGATVEEATQIEQNIESDGLRSALVGPVGGAATYPSIVSPPGDYESLVATVAHEWVHHYLSFKPLGRRYLSSIELRTLNETVASLAGRDLAALVVARYPLPPAIEAAIEREYSLGSTVDVDASLSALRLAVDDLLAEGQVDEAEALMLERQRELAAQGVVFRRINQAFFAFRGIYADRAGSVDPLGPKLETLKVRSGSVGAFLRDVAPLTSGDDLDRLLAGGS